MEIKGPLTKNEDITDPIPTIFDWASQPNTNVHRRILKCDVFVAKKIFLKRKNCPFHVMSTFIFMRYTMNEMLKV